MSFYIYLVSACEWCKTMTPSEEILEDS